MISVCIPFWETLFGIIVIAIVSGALFLRSTIKSIKARQGQPARGIKHIERTKPRQRISADGIITKNVIVVGAGPAGLGVRKFNIHLTSKAAGALIHEGVQDVLLIEKADRVAPAWHNHYERLHLHTAKLISFLPYLEMPAHWPTYVSKKQVAAYMEAYSKLFEMDIAFNTSVVKTEFNTTSKEWIVVAVDANKKETIYKTKFLIVASGENSIPNIPTFKNQESFKNASNIIHSSQYKNGSPYKGKKVLVVGFGNSGCEIALDLWEHDAQPSLVLRRPVNILTRNVIENSVALTYYLGTRYWIPFKITDMLVAADVKREVGDLSKFGIRHPHPDYGVVTGINQGDIPFIDIGTIDLIKKGHIKVFPGIKEFTQTGVIFEDGRKEDFDEVILATGFTPSLSFADQRALKESMNERGMLRHNGKEIPGFQMYFLGWKDLAGRFWEIRLEAIRIAQDIVKKL